MKIQELSFSAARDRDATVQKTDLEREKQVFKRKMEELERMRRMEELERMKKKPSKSKEVEASEKKKG